jgi:hypothetical protein
VCAILACDQPSTICEDLDSWTLRGALTWPPTAGDACLSPDRTTRAASGNPPSTTSRVRPSPSELRLVTRSGRAWRARRGFWARQYTSRHASPCRIGGVPSSLKGTAGLGSRRMPPLSGVCRGPGPSLRLFPARLSTCTGASKSLITPATPFLKRRQWRYLERTSIEPLQGGGSRRWLGSRRYANPILPFGTNAGVTAPLLSPSPSSEAGHPIPNIQWRP